MVSTLGIAARDTRGRVVIAEVSQEISLGRRNATAIYIVPHICVTKQKSVGTECQIRP